MSRDGTRCSHYAALSRETEEISHRDRLVLLEVRSAVVGARALVRDLSVPGELVADDAAHPVRDHRERPFRPK